MLSSYPLAQGLLQLQQLWHGLLRLLLWCELPEHRLLSQWLFGDCHSAAPSESVPQGTAHPPLVTLMQESIMLVVMVVEKYDHKKSPNAVSILPLRLKGSSYFLIQVVAMLQVHTVVVAAGPCGPHTLWTATTAGIRKREERANSADLDPHHCLYVTVPSLVSEQLKLGMNLFLIIPSVL